MGQAAILEPMVVMVVLTFAVWIWMYVTRIGFMRRERVNPNTFKDPVERLQKMAPVSGPSDNLKNLFEMPILFYLLCLTLMLTGRVDAVFVYLAWVYVLLRAVHSLIHCSYNRVIHRFSVYMLSSIALFWMWVRFLVA